MINDSSFTLEEPDVEDTTTPAPTTRNHRSRSYSPTRERTADSMNGAVTFADETDGAQGLDARRAIQGLAGNNSDPGPSMDIDPVAAATLGRMLQFLWTLIRKTSQLRLRLQWTICLMRRRAKL